MHTAASAAWHDSGLLRSHPLKYRYNHIEAPAIGDSYRAVGVRKNDDEIVWFFVGTHADYDKLRETL